jgi:hypothetical protein
MKKEIKKELITELGFVDEIAFNKAYSNAKGIDKEAIKKEIKGILIQLLHDNANKVHKTKLGKLGAFLSKVGAKILPFVNINKK